MNVDSTLRAELISSLFGQVVQPSPGALLWGALGFPGALGAALGEKLSLEEFHISTIVGNRTPNRELFLDEKEFFDPEYDHDFTNLSDTADCSRGDEPYRRPAGWYRLALKVKGEYPGGDAWLGTEGWRSHSVPGEWPVSYHGTSFDGAKGIIADHFKVGPRDLYGRGIYSTPDLDIAEGFARIFTSPTTGKTYKVVLQNRINPQERKICSRKDFWLIPVDAGTSPEKETLIVKRSIRPYGILIRELQSYQGQPSAEGADGAANNGLCTIN